MEFTHQDQKGDQRVPSEGGVSRDLQTSQPTPSHPMPQPGLTSGPNLMQHHYVYIFYDDAEFSETWLKESASPKQVLLLPLSTM